MPYTHYYPSSEAIPPQMKVDPSRSPITYETWPYGGNYGPSIPVGCHGLCNHSSYPGYCGFRPPYPHYPPPPPSAFHYHGGYPWIPETYPVHHILPPHFSMDQPRHEYDKNVIRDHYCCGCPYHSCNKNEDPRIKIEEQEPYFEKKTNTEKKASNSLVPFDFNNQPYPVVWIPSGNMNREQMNPTKPELKERDEDAHVTKAHENLKSSEQKPNVWSGWFPFDVNRFGSLNYGGDEKKTQGQPNVDGNQLPFPIFWLPYKPEEEGKRDHEEANNGQLITQKSPSNLKATPAHFPGSGDSTNQLRASQENFDSEVDSKTMKAKNSKQKIIPVKQLEEPEDKMMTEEAGVKSSGINVDDKEDNKEKLSSENGAKRHSSSPSKTSKLPPVCLRVDPLPKRKNGNGSSRSPSPPGHKAKSQDGLNESSKSTSPRGKQYVQHDLQSSSSTLSKAKEVDPNEKKRKTIEVMEVPVNLPIVSHKEDSTSQSTSEAGTNDVGNLKEDEESRNTEEKNFVGAVKSRNATIKDDSGDSRSLTQESQEDNVACQSKEENPDEEKKAKGKILSEAEAAIVIQSVYRGFEVRRWEPLKKMKQIAEVRDLVTEVRRRIEALESSSIGSDSDNKQKIVIGETIMTLLLKLDAIQGLHPTIRDFRKSVAKELVNLQEKLDYLTTEKHETYPAKVVEAPSMKTGKNASIEGQNEAEVGNGNIVDDNDEDKKFGSQDSCLGGSTFGTQATETSDLKSTEKEVCMEPEDESTGSPLGHDVDSGKEEVGPVNKLKDELTNDVLDDGQCMVLKTRTEDPELKHPVEPLPLLAEENANSVHKVALPSPPLNQLEKSAASNCVVQGVGEVEPLLAIDVDTTQVQPLDASKEEKIVTDLEGKIGREPNEDSSVKREELLLHPQGEVANHITDHVETSNIEELLGLKENEPLEDVRLEIEGLNVQKQGNCRDHLMDASGQQESWWAQNEIQGGEEKVDIGMTNDVNHIWKEKEVSLEETEKCKVESEVSQSALLPAQNETHDGGQKVVGGMNNDDDHIWEEKEVFLEGTEKCKGESEVPQPELLPVQNETHDREQEVVGMANNDDLFGKEKEVSLEESEECKAESKIITGDLNQDLASKPEEPHLEINEVSKADVPQPEIFPAQNEIHSGKQKEDGGMNYNDDNSWKEEKEAPIEESEERDIESKLITEEKNQGLETDGPEPEGLEGRQLAPAGSERHQAEGELFTISPTAVFVGSDIGLERERKLLEENEKMREMMEKLIEAGREQLTAISSLSSKVKELEKKLARKKKLRVRQVRDGSSCVKPSNDSLQGRVPRVAV
ncbi:Large proline-rich protein bag6 [Sarracenia purpurea var. burkii]